MFDRTRYETAFETRQRVLARSPHCPVPVQSRAVPVRSAGQLGVVSERSRSLRPFRRISREIVDTSDTLSWSCVAGECLDVWDGMRRAGWHRVTSCPSGRGLSEGLKLMTWAKGRLLCMEWGLEMRLFFQPVRHEHYDIYRLILHLPSKS